MVGVTCGLACKLGSSLHTQHTHEYTRQGLPDELARLGKTGASLAPPSLAIVVSSQTEKPESLSPARVHRKLRGALSMPECSVSSLRGCVLGVGICCGSQRARGSAKAKAMTPRLAKYNTAKLCLSMARFAPRLGDEICAQIVKRLERELGGEDS